MTYEIQCYTPEFKDQVLNLFTHLWTPNLEANQNYFTWKHESNPYLAEPLFYLALDGAKVVGVRGFFGGRWQLGGETTTCLSLADTVVAGDYRNQGISKELTRHMLNDQAQAGRRYVLHLSSGPVMRQVSYSLGCQSLGSMERLRRKPHGGPPAENPVGPVRMEENPRPREMAELVGRRGAEGRIQQIRDGDFFSWRFANPLARYQFFYWGRQQLEGYLVLQTSVKSNHRFGNMVDWESSHPEVFGDLIAAALFTSSLESVSIWGATLPDAYRGILLRSGFQCCDESPEKWPTVLVVPTGAGESSSSWLVGGRDLRERADWNLRMIFSDSY